MGPFLRTWQELLNPAFYALGQVERWGAILSESNVRLYDAYLDGQMEKARAELGQYPQVPPDLNTKSPKQMADVLYKTLKLPVLAKTATKVPSTKGDVLVALAKRRPDVKCLPAIISLQQARAQRDMYGIGQLKHIGYDGRVHTKYKIVRSGRLSSSEPNLQNLTAPDDDDAVEDAGKWARGCYVAPEGCSILLLDYSQNELRVACALSGDDAMAADFNSGVDYHNRTGQRIFGAGEISKLQRRIAKAINFAIVFGGNEFTVSEQLGITPEKGLEYIDAFNAAYPKLFAWRKEIVRQANMSGISWAIWDREGWTHRRYVTEIGLAGDTRAVQKMRAHAERVAQNNPVQNIANCFGLAALARTVAWILDSGVPAELNLTVHDSLVLYVRTDLVDEVAHEVKGIMTGFDLGIVQLKVDAEVGDRDMGHTRKIAVA
jgi:DNA polymerase-1